VTDFLQRVDVLVIGAGPAGSATAALLADAGLEVMAVDRAAFPRDKPCAEYMSPEAVRILNRLGVVEPLEEAGGVALTGMKVTACHGATAHGVFAEARHQPFRPTGLSVSRRILDHQLVGAARSAGAIVQERAALEDLVLQNGSVSGAVIRDQDGLRHLIRARLTVGADGLRSIVARRIGRRVHGAPRRLAFVAHLAGVRDMGSSAELHFGRAGYVGLNDIGLGQVNVAVVLPQKLAAAARGRVNEYFFESLEEFPGVRERVRGARLLAPVQVTGPFAARSRRVIAPGALLVGDAADFFDPVTGDGIYTALRGAELVAETMTPSLQQSGPVSLRSLQRYRRRRGQVFTGKWMMERITRYLMAFPGFFDRTVARLGRHSDMAHTAIGAAGGFVPLRELLAPSFIARAVL
jgi:menaquinone-9 beta-reductase